MPRGARILMEDVCYHVISRGNQKQRIFLCDEDYETYLGLLARYRNRFYFNLYSYCLMPNHVHLLLDPKRLSHLSSALAGLQLTYTKYFNEKYKKVGHLWQDRFKSLIVEKDAYLIQLVNYIEMNPVRAEIVQDPMAYPWSSYRTRVTGDGKRILDEIEV